MNDGQTVSFPPRENEGYGCPRCGAPLPSDGSGLGLAAVRGLRCCGYYPEPAEAFRWALAAERLRRDGSARS
jgi:hypothetical protein